MAHLLGNRLCIESLEKDVRDIHAVLTDIVSRTGPVHARSWKFPDTAACDVDIPTLLEHYHYSDVVEENEMSHIILQELVIDRLIFLIQCLSHYVSSMKVLNASLIKPGVKPTVIGIIIRKYWNEILQMQTVLQNLECQIFAKDQKIEVLLKKLKTLENSNEICQDDSKIQNESTTQNAYTTDERFTETGTGPNKKLQKTKNCSLCPQLEQLLQQSELGISKLCQIVGIQAVLKKPITASELHSAEGILKWTEEQCTDIERLAEHISAQSKEMNSLCAFKEKCSELQEKLGSKKEKSKDEINQDILALKAELEEKELKIASLTDSYSKKIVQLSECNEELNRAMAEAQDEKTVCQNKIKKLAKKVQVAEKSSTELESTKNALCNADERCKELTKQFNETNQLYAAERKAKDAALARLQCLELNQKTLNQTLETTKQHNEKLHNTVNELNKQVTENTNIIEDYQEQIKQSTAKIEESDETITCLKRANADLETQNSIIENNVVVLQKEIVSQNEQVRMLVEYPDLNGPLGDETATGDIVRDMENQVKSNVIRIQVLEQQNHSYRQAISKLIQNCKADCHSDMHNHSQEMVLDPKGLKFNQTSANMNSQHLTTIRPQARVPSKDLTSRLFEHPSNDCSKPATLENPMMSTVNRSSNACPTYLEINNCKSTGTTNDTTSIPLDGCTIEGHVNGGIDQEVNVAEFAGSLRASSRDWQRLFADAQTDNTESEISKLDSSRKSTPVSSTSDMTAYIHTQKAAVLQAEIRNTALMKAVTMTKDTDEPDVEAEPALYACEKCERMYAKKLDLDVHMLYCVM